MYTLLENVTQLGLVFLDSILSILFIVSLSMSSKLCLNSHGPESTAIRTFNGSSNRDIKLVYDLHCTQSSAIISIGKVEGNENTIALPVPYSAMPVFNCPLDNGS
jgi:hypothetical protein